MTISSQTRTAGPFFGTGLLVPYPFSFKIFLPSDLLVVQIDASGNETTLGLSTNYTVTLNADQNGSPGGTVTLLSPLLTGYTLTFTSNVALTQPLSLPNSGPFYPQAVENEFDRLTILMQQLGFNFAQTVRTLDIGGLSLLPSAPARAGKLLGFDPITGDVSVIAPNSQDASSVALALAAQTTATATQLASSVGGGLIGYNYAALYPGTSVGHKLQEVLSIMDVPGTDNTGVADNYTQFQVAVSAAAVMGKDVSLPSGSYNYNPNSGSLILNQVRLVGEGVRDRTGVAPHFGAVINITGAGNSPFLLQSGSGLVGLNINYPAQTDAACIVNGGVPLVYPATCALSFANGPVQYVTISDCVVPNCYKFLDMDNGAGGAMGHIGIFNNNIYSIFRDIYCRYNAETIRIVGNDFTFGVSNDATEAGLRKWTRANGTSVQFDQSDGFTMFDNLVFGKNIWFACIVGTVAIDDMNFNKIDEVSNGIFVSSTGQMLASRMIGNQLICYNSQLHTMIGAGVTLNASAPSQFTMVGTVFGETAGNHVAIAGSASNRINILGGEMDTPGLFQTTGAWAGVNVNNVSALVVLRSIAQMVGGANAITYGVLCSNATLLDVQGCFMSAFESDIRVTSCGIYIDKNNYSDTTFGTVSNDISGVLYPQGPIGSLWDKPAPGAGVPSFANDAAASGATPPLPRGWTYYNTTVHCMTQRVV